MVIVPRLTLNFMRMVIIKVFAKMLFGSDVLVHLLIE